ncbi:DUF2321 domain-containing protein [Rhodoblastus acidophilus]|uniref:DUF2321 domain-containing protein n=1 Tax=Candidatus Rhodoblastus alkanivorans TaxID=2954117 RepID=A0ABS9Z9J9_9HYPH|nr:DUF2321 domain-containing protein [Candidatus Rhodoblastus alkanivorans]MCI4680154.1 DUF2321 domain-containing protein [Candidatus Rhodoblastus alkanivorans]MCI4684111.1 DUF2321 domain-containing protein [Candidatus Rhodoblastus alkanivorans]MDI4641431.1 DUF2321 domain-containing protein [Rhodoblastus acidophilus]
MLSDACFDFLQAFSIAAVKLFQDVHHYSAPAFSSAYGPEIAALRRACAKFQEQPYDAEAGAELLRLAKTIMFFHDTPPSSEKWEARRHEMKRLIQVIQNDLDEAERGLVPQIVSEALTSEDTTNSAAIRMKGLLSKLTKGAYDIAIKIISDIGSEVIKKPLGL